MKPISGLAFIENKYPTNALMLFKEWLEEAAKYCHRPRVMNLATSNKQGRVSNRTVVLRELMEDAGLVLVTLALSRKVQDIMENPQVAVSFVWLYSKEDKSIARQVKIEGIAEKLPPEQCEVYYEREPLFCKIRSHICEQGKPVDWAELKSKHDSLLKDVLENKKQLKMPDYQVAFKVVPKRMEFYLDWDNYIGDRLLFTRTDGDKWKSERLAA